jgi:hypothetical protein
MVHDDRKTVLPPQAHDKKQAEMVMEKSGRDIRDRGADTKRKWKCSLVICRVFSTSRHLHIFYSVEQKGKNDDG